MKTKLVLLGTGTPNACPNANGPSSAVVVGDRANCRLWAGSSQTGFRSLL